MVKLGVAAAAIAGIAVVGGVTATSAQAAPCGGYETSSWAYYNHCGSGYVQIKVDRNWPTKDTYQCVGPGITGLGTADGVNRSWYVGGC
jgi:hypothetical protein